MRGGDEKSSKRASGDFDFGRERNPDSRLGPDYTTNARRIDTISLFLVKAELMQRAIVPQGVVCHTNSRFGSKILACESRKNKVKLFHEEIYGEFESHIETRVVYGNYHT